MHFKNAYKGLRNLITAEWLGILVTITGIATAALGLFSYAAWQAKVQEVLDKTIGPMTVLALVTLVLALLAYLLQIIGLIKAGKDESEFKKALLYIFIGFVMTAVAGFLKEKLPWLETVGSFVSQLANTFAMLHVINGIAELADQFFNDKMIKSGKAVASIVLITFVIWLLGQLSVKFVFKDPKSNINVILTIASMVMGLIQTFSYLIYLIKGKKMLEG